MDADRTPGEEPSETYGPNCWQIFFMPANPDLTWGVVYAGPTTHFSDGGLRGVRMAHRTRDNVTTMEVRIPLGNFGLASGAPASWGFALAVNDVDSDVEPSEGSSYLSWNSGFELFKRPRHFGTLHLPAHRSAAPASEGGWGWTWLWVLLSGAGLALLLVGPGSQLLRRMGWKPKAVALAAVVFAAFLLRSFGASAVEHARADVRARLSGLAEQSESVVERARAVGALREATESERAASLQRLLVGDGIPCRPGIEAAAFVSLHPTGRHPTPTSPVATGLDAARTWPLALEGSIGSMHVAFALPRDRRPRQDAFGLGTLRLEAADGSHHEHLVRIDADTATSWTERVVFSPPRAWRHMSWTPHARGLGASLRSVHVERDGQRTLAWTARRTRAGVPVLAHSSSQHAGRKLSQRETLQTPLPGLLGGADRLWILLRSEKSYPELLGDVPLATVRVQYEIGAAREVVLRNGEHLGSTHLPIGVRRPAGMQSRVAWRSAERSGFERIQEAIPIALDTARRPRAIEIENHEAGGALTVVAATMVRSRRPDDADALTIVYDDESANDRCLSSETEAFREHIRPARDPARAVQSERVRAVVGPAQQPIPLELVGEVPASAFAAQQRSNIALLICLVLAAVLFVLLVIDWTDHVGRLTQRLALGVLAAALIPFTITLVMVDRNQRRGVEADAAASVRAALDDLDGRVRNVASRARTAAQALARQLHARGADLSQAPLSLRTTRDASAALEASWPATAWIVGARLPPVHVALSSTAGGLATPRFLAEVQDRPGLHVSPWDGCVAVGTARAGLEDDWVHVVVGVRVEDALVDPGAAEPPRTALLLDRRGTPLAVAGEDLAAVRAALGERTKSGGTIAPEASPYVGVHGVVGTTSLSDRLVGETEGPILAAGIARRHLSRLVAVDREPLIWLGLLGLTFMVCAAALVARHVAGPVRVLAEASDAVRMGDFDVPVPAGGRDEVGRLAVAFDQMRHGLRERVEDLATLRNAQERLTTSLDFDTRTSTALAVLREETGADRAGLLESRGPQGPVAWVAEDPLPGDTESHWTDRPFAVDPDGPLAAALVANEPLAVATHEADDGESGAEARLLSRASAWLALPLRVGDHRLGLVLLGWNDASKRPREGQSKLLAPLTGIVASALNNAHLYRLAALDEVTRLPGATAFEAVLRRDIERAVTGGPPVTLLRIGIDRLEHVQREQGVEAAHELTRAVAQALQGVIDDPLRLGRTRTDELGACTIDASPGAARELAEAVRRRVAAVDVPTDTDAESLASTVSIGLATCPENARSLEFLADAAGRALEAARREGGDRVEDVSRIDAGAVEVPPFEEGAIFRNERMVAVVEAARRAARADASVLITGETGTGKEVIANLIHRRSVRVQRPFVSVNCAAFPETLLESELFGYERGAFTGADHRREGRFELADGGTLFLDEIGDLSATAQVKLLRVLQERQFTRLGGTRTISVDVRIIAATNRDLEETPWMRGSFREDLYFRLKVIPIMAIPPLREREARTSRSLVAAFHFGVPPANSRRTVRPRWHAGADERSSKSHHWPGNVRELKNVIERCAVLCDADVATAEHLQLDGGASEGAGDLLPRRAPRDDLNPRQRKLLDHLARHGRCTNREYYEMTETSPRTGLRDLQDLMNRGLLVREGKRRGAVYRLP